MGVTDACVGVPVAGTVVGVGVKVGIPVAGTVVRVGVEVGVPVAGAVVLVGVGVDVEDEVPDTLMSTKKDEFAFEPMPNNPPLAFFNCQKPR